MELNRALRDDNGRVYDIIAGPFLICGLDGERFGSLPDELISKFSEQFKQPEMFFMHDGEIKALPVKIIKSSIKEQLQRPKKEQGKEYKKPPQMPGPEL